MVEKLKSAAGNDWARQFVGSVATVLLGLFVAWIAGFIDMKYAVIEQGHSLVEMKTDVASLKKDTADLKLGGFKADAELATRVSVMESQHTEILRYLGRAPAPPH